MTIGPKEAALRKQREAKAVGYSPRRPAAFVAGLKADLAAVEKAVTKPSRPVTKVAKKKRPKPKPKGPVIGRPRVYETPADRQRAYRERKANA